MIDILYDYTFYNGISGTFTSLVDTYFNLKRFGVDCRFHLFLEKTSTIKNALTFFPEIDFDIIQSKKEFIEANKTFVNLVASAETIYSMFVPVTAKRIIVLDSLSFYRLKNDTRFRSRMNMLKNAYFLMNPWTEYLFDSVYGKKFTYYHKFSRERLDFLKKKFKICNNNNILCRKYGRKNPEFNSFEYDSLYYYRYVCVDGNFVENIGKLIFEYRYLEKDVYYSPHTKTIDDGLTFYLKLFNVDDSACQDIYISDRDIESRLLMSENDVMLNIISDFKEM